MVAVVDFGQVGGADAGHQTIGERGRGSDDDQVARDDFERPVSVTRSRGENDASSHYSDEPRAMDVRDEPIGVTNNMMTERGGGNRVAVLVGTTLERNGAAPSGTPPTVPTPMLEELFLKKCVVFAPAKEPWMSRKTFDCVGTAYIVGAVARYSVPERCGNLSVAAVQRGIENYQALRSLPNNPAWRDPTDNVTDGELRIDAPLDDLEVSTVLKLLRPPTEDAIFGGAATSLDNIMSLNRFKMLRRCFSFRADPGASVECDPAARIRPLLNLLKCTGGRYIEVGRDLALDEASVACRSRQGRRLIVFNPQKPGGRYHFRMYLVCCATTWIALNYRLHSNTSDIADRLRDLASHEEIQQLREEFEKVSQGRKHVLEVVRPYFHSRRIVNMDNYYTSVQLLLDLRLKGTVRSGSKHYPKHTILDKDTACRRDFQQSVAVDHNILAASWCDGSIVTMVTSADGSKPTTVTRRIRDTNREFPDITCILQYNQHMQGVDRLDQLRARFSLADGHSYKRWHKKLALSLVDIARVNAHSTQKMAIDTTGDRDPHRILWLN
ncbi:hypothetical protein ON010_g8460 [Phytophthora cinnamomi]|nr:hypothetical protein ON010_g8460 [Phytophthora cinnamomi]